MRTQQEATFSSGTMKSALEKWQAEQTTLDSQVSKNEKLVHLAKIAGIATLVGLTAFAAYSFAKKSK